MGPDFDPIQTMAWMDSQRRQPAPRPMWTDLRPGRVGLYWMKTPSEEPRVVKVWQCGEHLDIGDETMPPRGTLWYGPIEPPPITIIKRAL